ncbi:MAG: nitronate monooxygenase [Gammaproteobacteria bacterium]|jgi:nitronate monooxygenase|nr:nitronate monooxygenase [Gammaproteobacteria bacterium]
MTVLNDFRLRLGDNEYLPIMVGGMGVDISTSNLALEACRLGGIGHISDAMTPWVSDRHMKTHFTKTKSGRYKFNRNNQDKTKVKFNLDELYKATLSVVSAAVKRKQGSGGLFINVMEKLTMGAAADTLGTRLKAALDAGIDGITLSAGLHNGTLKLIKDHPRFHEVKIGIIVSSVRALKIFLRSGQRVNRLPDYCIVEGPLAGGHLGFGEDWADYDLKEIVPEVLDFVKSEELDIAVIPAGGIFTGTDAVEYMQMGCGAVQVATRFTITQECGLPTHVKQEYLKAEEEDVEVNGLSATGYLIRMLKSSPAIGSNIKPQCEPLGYTLSSQGTCLYVDAYYRTGNDENGKKLPVMDKICICHHFGQHNVWTCGHNVYRLKDTTNRLPDGTYQLPPAEHVFNDYLYSENHEVALPKLEVETA